MYKNKHHSFATISKTRSTLLPSKVTSITQTHKYFFRKLCFLFTTFLFLTSIFSSTIRAECKIQYKNQSVQRLDEQKWKYTIDANQQNSSPAFIDANWPEVSIHKNWKRITPKLEQISYRCYIITGSISPEDRALFLGKLEVENKVFFNGTQIGESGNAEKNLYDTTTPILYTIPNSLWQIGQNTITIFLKGKAIHNPSISEISIVTETSMAKKMFLREIPTILTCVAYYLIALLILLFYFTSNTKYNLYLSLFSIFIGSFFLLETWLRSSLLTSSNLTFLIQRFLLCLSPILFTEFFLDYYNINRKRIHYLLYSCSIGVLFLSFVFNKNFTIGVYIIRLNIFLFLAYMIYFIKTVWLEERKIYFRYGGYIFVAGILFDIIVFYFFPALPFASPYCLLIFIGSIFIQILKDIDFLYKKFEPENEKNKQLMEEKKYKSIKDISSEFQYYLIEAHKILMKDLKEPKKIKKESIGEIKGILTGISTIFQNYKILKSIDTNTYLLKPETINLYELMQNVFSKACLTSKQNQKRIIFFNKEKELMINTEVTLLNLIFYNILQNALLYTKGKVACSLEVQEKEILIKITDEGPSVSDKVKKNIFHKFTRGENLNENLRGLGLGLYLVKKSIILLGGKLDFHNHHGSFSEFTIKLPI